MTSAQAGQEPDTLPLVHQARENIPRLLIDGTIHSIAEPYSEAMVVDDGLISWLGDPDTAGRLTDRLERQELGRALVAPAFVGRLDRDLESLDAGGAAAALDVAAAHGQGALRLMLGVSAEELDDPAGQLRTRLIEVVKAARWHPVVVLPAVRMTGLPLDDGPHALHEVRTAVGRLLDLLEHVDDAAGAPVGVELRLAELIPELTPQDSAGTSLSSGDVRELAVEHLVTVSAAVAEESRQLLLEVGGHPPAAVAALVAETRRRLQGRGMTPRPDRPTVLVDFDSAHRQDWEALVGTAVHVLLCRPGHLGLALSVGIPTSVAPSEAADPWQLVAAHVHREESAVSVRAAFNAQTRAAHRSLPAADGAAPALAALAPQLDPGAAASYTVWEAETLAVQTPDSRTAAWSTDARARTPLLPYLGTVDEPAVSPVLRATVIGGVEVHGTAEARHSGTEDS
ncbi:hypothetical protein [Nesterenkonia sp. HG001]|uniref:hypothetical protein n=1 Tax=Nesterenkonia sp. HG001 TaxID=2983207 RepID=UPI002AC575AE|nr:hypothetical protein [Nesterenkonia sp. HG001]MDZ5078462.1 hypothetical protein [Nesterenkonia sp. HG001]